VSSVNPAPGDRRTGIEGLLAAFYRLILGLYPRSFRGETSAHLLDSFRIGLRQARGDSRRAALAFGVRELFDLLRNLPAEWRRRPPGPSLPRSPRRNPTVSFDSFLQDLRFSIRSLRSSPGSAAVAIVTLGLGIGATAAIFSVVNTFLFRPLPVENPGELVIVANRSDMVEFPHGISWPDFEDYRRENDVFESMIAFQPGPASLRVDEGAERVWVSLTTGNYFEMLGLQPRVGRIYRADENRSPGAAPYLVLQHDFWQRRFGGDPGVVGRTVRVNGTPVTVVGVAPEGFHGTFGMIGVDGWIPSMMADQVRVDGGILETRDYRAFRALGRLRPGVELAEAEQAMQALAGELAAEFPDTNQGVTVALAPETHGRPDPSMMDYLPSVAATFMALVTLVLLIACANVANLLLSRATSRRREMAVRAALGAGRLRVLRQLLTESTVLGVLGAGVGLAIAYLATAGLNRMMNAWPEIPLMIDMSPDVRVLGFAAILAVGTGLVAGVAPALQIARRDLSGTLKDGGRGTARSGSHHLQNALVAAQVAVTTVLLVAAGLFLRSLWEAHDVDLGIDPEGVLLVSMDPGLVGYEEPEADSVYQRVVDRVAGLPGVRSVSYSSFVPMSGNASVSEITVEGRPTAPEEQPPTVFRAVVGKDYFATAGTTLVRGRSFRESDREATPGVAVVNQTMARRLWPGGDALGQRISTRGRKGPWMEVVGIAQDGKYLLVGEQPRSFLYLPASQRPIGEGTLWVRSDSPPEGLAAAVRAEIEAVDADLPVYNVRTLEAHLQNGNAFLIFRTAALMVGSFGAVGLLLAAVGLYGVVAFSVGRRTQEIGLRMALGAREGRVLGLVLRRGMLLCGVGLALGVLATWLLGGTLASLLVGVSPRDPLTLAAVVGFLATISLVATGVPAWRATRVEPVVALRQE